MSIGRAAAAISLPVALHIVQAVRLLVRKLLVAFLRVLMDEWLERGEIAGEEGSAGGAGHWRASGGGRACAWVKGASMLPLGVNGIEEVFERLRLE